MRKIEDVGDFFDMCITPTIFFTERSKTKWVRALGQILVIPFVWWSIIVCIIVAVFAILVLFLFIVHKVFVEIPRDWWRKV